MNRFFTSFIAILLCNQLCLGQLAGSTFYGKQPEKYKGHKLKVISTPDPYTYYMLDRTRDWNESGNTYLPGNPPVTSDPHSIFGKEFFVYNVTSGTNGNSILEMKEVSRGDTVYYYYDPNAGNSFTMRLADSTEVETDKEPVDYCSRLEVTKDKFTGTRTVSSPYRSFYTLRLYKDITPKKTVSYTLFLYTTSDQITASNKGVIILLDNGTKISKPNEEVESEVRKYKTHGFEDFLYSAAVSLTANDRALLLKHRIVDFRLYVYDQEVIESEGDEIREYLQCLIQKK